MFYFKFHARTKLCCKVRKTIPVKEVPVQGIPVKEVPKKKFCWKEKLILKQLQWLFIERVKRYIDAVTLKAPTQSSTIIPTEERIWRYVPCQKYVTKDSFPMISAVVNILRHCPNLWEDDGAISWKVVIGFWSEAFPETKTWTSNDFLSSLEQGTNKIRFEYCLDNNGDIQYMRALQGHSWLRANWPKTAKRCFFLCGWTDYMYQVGSGSGYRSICDNGLIAKGSEFKREGRQTCFFTTVKHFLPQGMGSYGLSCSSVHTPCASQKENGQETKSQSSFFVLRPVHHFMVSLYWDPLWRFAPAPPLHGLALLRPTVSFRIQSEKEVSNCPRYRGSKEEIVGHSQLDLCQDARHSLFSLGVRRWSMSSGNPIHDDAITLSKSSVRSLIPWAATWFFSILSLPVHPFFGVFFWSWITPLLGWDWLRAVVCDTSAGGRWIPQK